MIDRLAADLVLLTHFAFIILVVCGALVVFRFPRFAWIHVPAAAWGAFVELSGRICPLTYLENFFRMRAGQDGYSVSFVEQYILPLVYPAGLTRNMQLLLGALVVCINVIIYATIVVRKRT